MNKGFVLIIILNLLGCASGVVLVDSRDPGIAKSGTMFMHKKFNNMSKKPQIYVKNKTISIVPKKKENSTGSLYNLKDTRNKLFVVNYSPSIGDYITIKIASSRSDDKSSAGTKGSSKKTLKDESSGDPDIQKLLKAFPDLEPTDKTVSVLKKFKMKVNHINENGDLLLSYKRSSLNGDLGREIFIKARLPYSFYFAKDKITTDDLSDIKWLESGKDGVLDRYSSSWEDEYTLRLSGFTEAKSRKAAELAEKQNSLNKIRDELRNQLISIGKERKTMSAEREKVFKERANLRKKLSEARKLIEEQKTKLQDAVSGGQNNQQLQSAAGTPQPVTATPPAAALKTSAKAKGK